MSHDNFDFRNYKKHFPKNSNFYFLSRMRFYGNQKI